MMMLHGGTRATTCWMAARDDDVLEGGYGADMLTGGDGADYRSPIPLSMMGVTVRLHSPNRPWAATPKAILGTCRKL